MRGGTKISAGWTQADGEEKWAYQNVTQMDLGRGIRGGYQNFRHIDSYARINGGTKISGRLNPMRGYVGIPKFQPDGPRRREDERGYQNLSRTDPGGGRRRECRSEV